MKEENIFTGKLLQLVIQDNRWEIIKHPDAVAILAMQDGKMLLVKQYRHGAGTDTWEAPAGLIDPDEKPLEAAKRELIEECGLTGEFKFLTSFYASPGFCDEKIHLFAVENLQEINEGKIEGEIDEIMWLEPKILLKRITENEIKSSAPTVLAALYSQLLYI